MGAYVLNMWTAPWYEVDSSMCFKIVGAPQKTHEQGLEECRGEYFYLFAYNHIGIVLEFQYFFGKVLTFGKKNSGKF